MSLYNIKRKRESIVVCSNQIQDNDQHTTWTVEFRTNVGSKLLNNCLKVVSFSYFTERILSSVSTRVSHSTQSIPHNPDSGSSGFPRHPDKCFSLQQRNLLNSMYFIPANPGSAVSGWLEPVPSVSGLAGIDCVHQNAFFKLSC